MIKNYIIYPDKIFKDLEGGITPYNPDWQKPYQLYRTKQAKGTVLVMVKAPGVTETNNNETIIELFDLATQMDARLLHFSLILPSKGIRDKSTEIVFGTKQAIPRPELFSILWKSSPYNLIKSLVAIEQQMIKDGFVHQPEIANIFNFEGIKSTMNVEEFFRKNELFIK